jgi:hypothetical protein
MNNLTEREISQLVEKLGGDDYARKVITGENVIKLFPSEYFVTPDRTLSPMYHKFYKVVELVYPELESEGPAFFSIDQLEVWIHEDQNKRSMDGWMKGDYLLSDIHRLNIFERCLNLQDGYAILEKGFDAYYKLFGVKTLLLWKSIFKIQDGSLFVPSIFRVDNDRLIIRPLSISSKVGNKEFSNTEFSSNYITPLFKAI